MKSKISVVTVCYNAVDSIEKTILSVINQTYQNIEYIIIDGGSTDGTVDVIKKYISHIAYWVSEPDKGIYDAMNKGIANATGDYINFMNAGDYFINNHIVADIAISVQNEYADVVFGNAVYLLGGTYYEVKATPFYVPPFIKHSMGFNHQCCFVKMEKARRFPFDLKYRLAADYNMIMTIFHNKGTFSYINLPVAYYDISGVSKKQAFMRDAEAFSISSPETPIANYFKVRRRAVVRIIRRFLKFLILRVAPNIIEKKRAADSRMRKIEILNTYL